VSTKIGYSVNMSLLRNFLHNHSYILNEVLHWGLLKTDRFKFKIPVEL